MSPSPNGDRRGDAASQQETTDDLDLDVRSAERGAPRPVAARRGRRRSPAPGRWPSRTLRGFWGWLDTRGANRVVQAGMLALVASIAFLYYQDRQQAACMERYNEATSAVSRQRADATNQDWAALDALVERSRNGGFAPGADDYLAIRDKTLKLRADNPLTAPPSDYCS